MKALKAAVVVSDWKLATFRKRLTEAGFAYTDGGAGPEATTVLSVEYEGPDLGRLTATITACQAECAAQWRAGK